MLIKLFLGEKLGQKRLILVKTYFLILNCRNYSRKAFWVVQPDLAVYCQNIKSGCRIRQLEQVFQKTWNLSIEGQHQPKST